MEKIKYVIENIVYRIKLYFHYVVAYYYILRNRNKVRKKITNGEVLNCIFIIQYIPSWVKLEPVYLKMKNDSRFNPIILCVPLNIQNHILMDDKGNDTYDYFIDNGYEAINALNSDGSWYDLHTLNPDYVFHSRPYNSYLPECYTSYNIVKYSLICNILYGMCITNNLIPVTINRGYFCDVYCYFAFDKYEIDYFKRLFFLGCKLGIKTSLPYGSTSLEQILVNKVEKKKNEFTKTILWTPRWSTDKKIGGSNFFNYKDILLKFAKEHPNIKLILRPHPLMLNNFIETGEMTKDEVEAFKEYCRTENNLILDEEKEYNQTFWNSDILITDVSSIVPEYFITKHPIIYCHSNINYQYTNFARDMIHSCYEVYNESELITSLSKLIFDKDEKEQLRIQCIDSYFNNLENNSGNIVDFLAAKSA